MINIIIGIIIGVICTLIVIKIQSYLKTNNRKLDWKNILIALSILFVSIWLIYSFIGMAKGDTYETKAGNHCKGYKYGMKICWGDINAE